MKAHVNNSYIRKIPKQLNMNYVKYVRGHLYRLFFLVEASSKVFKNRRESRWNVTLNEPVPRLIRRFVWDYLTQKSNFVPNKRPASIALFSQSSYKKKFTSKLDCSLYMFGSCKELSSAKMEPTNPRAFSRTTFKEHRGKTSTHAPG